MPQTAEITVKIDKEQVDEWAKKRILELERALELACNREKRAKKKVKEYDAMLEENQFALTRFTRLFQDLLEEEPFYSIAQERFDYGGYA